MSKVPNFFKSNPEKTLALLLGVVILSLGVVFVTFAWTPPSINPPDGDISAPLNVSGSAQVKAGNLGIMTDLSGTGYDDSYAVSIGDSGDNKDGLKVSGTTTIDEGVLDMQNNKISNVSEIDPVFGIDGKKYVSYMPDSIGQKVYVVGESELSEGKKIIELDNQPEASDLWLFWKAVARDSVIPLVTAQGPADLYAKVKNNELIVKSMEGKDIPFSFRLIGTRIDHADSDNLYSDQDVQNYLDINKLRNQ